MHIEKGKRKSLYQQPYRLDEKYVDLILLWTFPFNLLRPELLHGMHF